jgi:glycosyltransferase involved in cell wall biosynthesis
MPTIEPSVREAAQTRAATAPCYAVLGRQGFSTMVMPWHLLALRLARRHPVAYVLDPESPLRGWLGRPSEEPPGVRVVAPVEFPLQRIPAVRRACHAAAARKVRASLGRVRGPLVAVLFPYASVETARDLAADAVAYVVTDDFSRHQDASSSVNTRFLAWEQEALGLADLVVPIADVLAVRLRAGGHRRVRVIPAAYDDESFRGAAAIAPALAALPRPILGFAGTVRASRIDLPLVAAVAKARPQWTLAFVGPVLETADTAFAALRELPNVRFLSCANASEVPAYVAGFDVVTCPYRDDPFNRGYYPMKVLDALAMGRPVVVAPRSDLFELDPHVLFAGDAASFVRATETQLAAGNGDAAVASRRAAIAPRSFTRWAQSFEDEVDAVLAARSGRRS